MVLFSLVAEEERRRFDNDEEPTPVDETVATVTAMLLAPV